MNLLHMDKQEKILNILKRDNLIREEQIEEIKKEISKDSSKFDEFLNKIIDNEKIVKAKAEFYNLPYMDITEMDISEGVLNVISREVAENYHIICFDKIGRTIKVGIVDPDNFKAVEAVNFLVLHRCVHNSIVASFKVLVILKFDESRIPQHGRIRLVIYGKEIDFRI